MINPVIGRLTDDRWVPDAATVPVLRTPSALQLTEATPLDGKLDRSALLTVVIEPNARELAASNVQAAQYRAVLENMAQGFCLFDGGQRLIVCNERYAEIYGLQAEHVQPGTTLQEVVEHRYGYVRARANASGRAGLVRL